MPSSDPPPSDSLLVVVGDVIGGSGHRRRDQVRSELRKRIASWTSDVRQSRDRILVAVDQQFLNALIDHLNTIKFGMDSIPRLAGRILVLVDYTVRCCERALAMLADRSARTVRRILDRTPDRMRESNSARVAKHADVMQSIADSFDAADFRRSLLLHKSGVALRLEFLYFTINEMPMELNAVLAGSYADLLAERLPALS